MLRAAFMLAALGAAAAQHDEAGRVHEHDERRHDDMRMHDPGHLISCQWLQAMTHDQREDEEHAENARERHDGTVRATRRAVRPACIAADSFSKTISKPMQTAGGRGSAGTTTFWAEQGRADPHSASSRRRNAHERA